MRTGHIPCSEAQSHEQRGPHGPGARGKATGRWVSVAPGAKAARWELHLSTPPHSQSHTPARVCVRLNEHHFGEHSGLSGSFPGILSQHSHSLDSCLRHTWEGLTRDKTQRLHVFLASHGREQLKWVPHQGISGTIKGPQKEPKLRG